MTFTKFFSITESTLKYTFFLLMLYVMLIAPYYTKNLHKILVYGGVLSFIYLLFISGSLIKQRLWKNELLIPISLLIYSFSFFLWVYLFGEFGGIYKSELQKAQHILAISMVAFFFVKNDRFSFSPKKIIFFSTLLFVVIAFFLSIYQIVYEPEHYLWANKRITFHPRLASTGAAYVISLISIVCVGCTPQKNNKIYIVLIALFSYTVVFATGTRAAILAYPFLFLCYFFLFPKEKISLKTLYFPFLIVIATILLTSIFFKEKIVNRVNLAIYEIQAYQSKENMETSIGFRFSMMQLGIQLGAAAPLGESLEQRLERGQLIIVENPIFSGTESFIENSHLHNEFIENFSLRGLWGVAALAFLYISIFYVAIKQRNRTLFLVGLTIVIYGLPDVILNGDLVFVFFPAICLTGVIKLTEW